MLIDAEVADALFERGRLVGVVTADGREHRADRVVLAHGRLVGNRALAAARGPPARAAGQGPDPDAPRGPDSRPCDRIVASERVYVVPRADGRVVVGATVEERGFDVQVTAGGVHELLREAYRALPEIAELELVEALAGLRPGTPDNAPLIGPGSWRGCCWPPATTATAS